MKSVEARYLRGRLVVNNKEVPTSLSPLELLVAALAYGVGVKNADTVGDVVVSCEVQGYRVACRGPCTGAEERCLVFQLLRDVINYECV
ncbi:hypothetical protein [Thermoproteus tenax]|uniref:Uncharacterized conserved protein n=1 Tax=Thermoproteus tenax (strain ATCC 35583 / DSM 2078 / JCM 9277 / NBRC 100435 / Kra 1) TaxID=768679 RepID=G4RMF3_THETK|nr:hypothetical protein [Thermoproteus tenax]CCC80784.1 Uncharacterized conserved protein [Thermoproteus tenax Kra 1]